MTDTDIETVEFAQKDAPDIVITGRLIADADSRDSGRGSKSQARERWTELHVYELASGDWVAVSIGMSDKGGESDVATAQTILKGDVADMRNAAMSFFGWTWLAKMLAKEAGWDVRRIFK